MQDKDPEISKTKKRVHWHESVEDKENLPKSKKPRLNIKPRQKFFDPNVKEGIKQFLIQHFSERTYDELKEKLSKYSLYNKIKILSVDNYSPMRWASIRSDIQALRFIIENVPEEIAKNMLNYGNFLVFKEFLLNERTREKFNQLNRPGRIECFKIFLKIDPDNLQNIFDSFNAKFSETDPIKKSLREDFDLAKNQLQEEGVITVSYENNNRYMCDS